MKVLVTGREGQVARSLAEAGVQGGMEMVFAARPDCDVRDGASVAAAVTRHAPDCVINAAAYTQVDRAESEEALACAVNEDGAAHVARACALNNIPLIHLSTDYVYDGEKPAPYVEGDATNPISVYGRSKLAGEQAVAKFCERHLIVRTAWIHSPFGNNFVRTMMRLAATRPQVDVVSDQSGCPTYALHLAEALLAMARIAIDVPQKIDWGIYHAAGQGETNWSDFARAIFAEARARGLPAANVISIATRDYPTAAKRPANSRLDGAKLRRALGITLPDWHEGVQECVARIAADHAAAA